MPCAVDAAIPTVLAIARNVQWVASCDGGACVRRMISAICSGGSGAFRRTRPIAKQAANAVVHEALLPAPNTGFGLAGLGHDYRGAQTGAAQKDDPSLPDVLLAALRVRDDGAQPLPAADRREIR